VTHPEISATTDSGPAATTARWNHGEPGSRPRRHQDQMNHRPSAARPVPIATMALNDNLTIPDGGWSSSGTVSSPRTVAFGSWKASSERALGTSIPGSNSSGAPSVVSSSPSKAASFTGWRSATVRAAQSPTSSWAGATSAAKLSATTRPVMCRRSRRPRSQP
jgi:hypothetical protein